LSFVGLATAFFFVGIANYEMVCVEHLMSRMTKT
jgi:hypothetical protein